MNVELTLEEFKRAVDNSPIGFAVTAIKEDPNGIALECDNQEFNGRKFIGRFYYANKAYCDILERPQWQVLHGDWVKWTPEPDRSTDVIAAYKATEGNIDFVEIYKCYTMRGEEGKERKKFVFLRYDVEVIDGAPRFVVWCFPMNNFNPGKPAPSGEGIKKWIPLLEWVKNNYKEVIGLIVLIYVLITGKQTTLPESMEQMKEVKKQADDLSGKSSSSSGSSDT